MTADLIRIPRSIAAMGRLCVVAAALAVFSVLWFAVGQLADPAPVIGWLPVPLTAALASHAAWQTYRSADDPAMRRFWRSLTAALGVLVLGTACEALIALTGQSAEPYALSLSSGLYVTVLLIVLYAILLLPVMRGLAGSERIQLTLDMSIVAVALLSITGGVFAILVPRYSGELSLLAPMIMGAVVSVVLMKLALVESGRLKPKVVRLHAFGAVSAVALGGGLVPLMTSPAMSSTQVAIPVGMVFMGAAAVQQRRGVAGAPSRVARRRFSKLPYIAALAVLGMLLHAVAYQERRPVALALAAVLVTGLVIVRQLVAFRENSRLVDRLDASMRDLRDHEARFRSLVQNSSDVITIMNLETGLSYISPSVERVLGTPPEVWYGMAAVQRVHPDDSIELQQLNERILQTPGDSGTCQVRLLHADGSWRWMEMLVTNRSDDPSVRGIVSNARDITDSRRFNERLEHQASHDSLTGLINRDVLAEQAADALAVDGAHVALALVDLDDFKGVNDRLGHAVGDALLVAVAGRLQNCIRPGDRVARLGGDEFAVLMYDVSPATADQIAARVLHSLRGSFHAGGHDLLIQASLGLVDGEVGMDASELLRRADVAMYQVKEQGKSGFLRYTEAMDAKTAEHAQIGADLQRALATGELFLVYQPVVELPDGRMSSVETLIRWRHGKRGFVSPAEFIPVAERNGMIVPIGAWVLRQACRQMRSWQDEYGAAAPAKVAVNVSARQLSEPSFPTTVADVLAETGLSPDDLMLEITETAVFDNGLALETVHALHALGVGLALDDFGTGHSSLGLLRSCPVDVIKVDKSFVDGVTGTVEQSAIVTSIAQIAQVLQMETVAEGVETAEQAARLYELGYRQAQGFHFARPLPAGEIEEMLRERRRELPRAIAS